MATLPDVVITNTAFVNLNSSTGLVSGTPLVIQNKGSSFVRIVISPTQPLSNSQNGNVIKPLKYLYIENESDIVWAIATEDISTALSVQQLV